MGAIVGPQHVAGVAVAMKSQHCHVAGALECEMHRLERVRAHARVDVPQVGRQLFVGEKPAAWRVPEAFDVERRPVHEPRHGTGRVDAAEETADPRERVRCIELRCAAASARIDSDTKAAKRVQRRTFEHQRRDDRNLAGVKLGDELMLLRDLRIAPASRTIELRDDRRLVLAPHLVDAVLVTVEREQAAVAADADGVERVEDEVGGQDGIGVSGHGGVTFVFPLLLSHEKRRAVPSFSCRLRSGAK